MGVQGVKRSTRDLLVTDAGEEFLPVANEPLNLWEGALETARLSRDECRGPIGAAVPVGIGRTFLVDNAARFLLERAHRNRAVEVHFCDRQHLCRPRSNQAGSRLRHSAVLGERGAWPARSSNFARHGSRLPSVCMSLTHKHASLPRD
jgi:hypothetical protein